MSQRSAASAPFSPAAVPESMATSNPTPEKYPTSASSTGYQSYPEVAPSHTQPPLQTYQQPASGYPQQQYQHQNGYAPEAGQTVPEQHKRNPWGLSPLVFGLLVAGLTAVIFGGAVGGGVAGAMSGNNMDSSSSKPSATVTVTASSTATSTSTSSPLPSSLENFVVPEPYYIDTLANPFCSNDNSRIEVQYGQSFDLFCGNDMQNHIADETNPDLVVADVVGIFAYSLTDCLYACANMVNFVHQWGQDQDGGNMQECKGVTWNYEMAANNASNFANCWLKNGTSSGFQCNNCVSGKLATGTS